MKTEISREDLLSFMLLEKDLQNADLEARCAALKRTAIQQAIQAWAAGTRTRYEMGPDDQISPEGKIVRKAVTPTGPTD